MNYNEWIPKTVKELRKAHEMTLLDLSEKSGFSVSYLSDIERGRTLPTIETLDELLKALGTQLVLSVEKDYTPPGYVVVKRETLSKASQLLVELLGGDGMCHCLPIKTLRTEGSRCSVCGGYLF